MGSLASGQTAGAFLVDRGVLTPVQLEEALELQRAQGGELQDIIAERFGIERAELDPAGAATPLRDIGEILLERGVVQAEQVDTARAQHALTGRPIGPILVELGAISRMELAGALAVQWKDRPARILPSPNGRDRGHSGLEVASTNGEVEDLRFAMRELEASVRATRSDDRGGSLAELRALVEELHGRLDGAASADSVRSALGEIWTELGTLGARVDGVGQSVDELAARPEVDPLLIDRVADLGLRVSAVTESAAGAVQRQERSEVELGSLGERVQDLVRTVNGLAARSQPDPALAERLDQLAQRVEEVTEVAEAASGVDGIQVLVGGLHTRIDEVERSASGAVSRFAPELAALRSTVRELSEGALVDPAHAEQLDQLRVRIDAVASTPERASAEAVAELDERVSTIAVSAAGGIEALNAAVAELQSRLTQLSDGPATEHEPDARIDELSRIVAELAERRPESPSDDRLDELAGRLSSLHAPDEALSRDVAALSDAVDSLGEKLPSELERLSKVWREERDALRERIEQLTHDPSTRPPGTPPSSVELAALAREVERLGDRVAEQERSLVEQFSRREKAILERLGIGGGDVAKRVDQLARVLDEQRLLIERLAAGPAGDGPTIADVDELKQSLHGTVERLATSLDRRFQRLEGGESSAAELVARVDRLTEIVESLAPVGSTAPDAPVSASYVALVPTGAGYQLVEVEGPTPDTGHRILSPLDGSELLVRGIGTSPFPGDNRACAIVEPAPVATAV